jgi:hypothetical protein
MKCAVHSVLSMLIAKVFSLEPFLQFAKAKSDLGTGLPASIEPYRCDDRSTTGPAGFAGVEAICPTKPSDCEPLVTTTNYAPYLWLIVQVTRYFTRPALIVKHVQDSSFAEISIHHAFLSAMVYIQG